MFRHISIVLAIVGALTATDTSGQEPTLRVALFPYVPNPEGIQKVIDEAWKKIHPDIAIDYVKWDGYSEDPPANLDVFEFDSIMLDYFARNSFLSPLSVAEVNDESGFYDFAVRGAMIDGTHYGVPRLACTPVLFFRKGDAAIENASSIDDLFAALGASPNQSDVPLDGKGLVIDLTGGTTCACLYLDAVADSTKEFSFLPDLPKAADLDTNVLGKLKLLTKMAGVKHATCEDCYEKRPPWFAEGKGRALVGWSERLAFMPKTSHTDIHVRGLPLADKNEFNIFFVDLLAVNSLLEGRKRELAIEFVNLATSSGVVLDTLRVKQPGTNSPQYLLPTRKTVMSNPTLLAEAPLYSELRGILEANPRTFRIGANVRHWLATTKKTIRTQITAP